MEKIKQKPVCIIRAPVATRSGYGDMSRDIVRHFIESDRFDVKIHSVPWGDTPTNALDATNPMDKMIIDTQALAKGAVGVTFNDGTSQPIMKIGSATVEAVNPEYWKLNGAIRLVLNTNFGGMAKSIRIGLLADESNTVKIVGPSGRLLNLDAIGVKSALENWLGSPYQKMLDRSTALKPNPYKTLMDVLNGIAAKYKSTGLAAPTKG